MAKVEEVSPAGIRLRVECYASPGDERRQDAQVYDKIYLKTKFLCHADRKVETFQEAQADRLEQAHHRFLRTASSAPGRGEMPFWSSLQQPVIWEIAQVDLLIHVPG